MHCRLSDPGMAALTSQRRQVGQSQVLGHGGSEVTLASGIRRNFDQLFFEHKIMPCQRFQT